MAMTLQKVWITILKKRSRWRQALRRKAKKCPNSNWSRNYLPSSTRQSTVPDPVSNPMRPVAVSISKKRRAGLTSKTKSLDSRTLQKRVNSSLWMETPPLNSRRIWSLSSKVSMVVKRVKVKNQTSTKARIMLIDSQIMEGVVIKVGKIRMKDWIRLNEFIRS